MPLYDFRCRTCGHTFEERTALDAAPPPCPRCGSTDTERVIGGFAIGSSFVRPTGADAKRSDAQRAARESQRQERIAARRAQREQQ